MDSDKPFHNPFGALAKLTGVPAPEPAASDPAPSLATPPTPPAGKTIPKVVVRMERKGRGGKEVTVLEQLNLAPIIRERWLKELKATLGCGGVIEGNDIVLQGDHRKRLPAVLAKKGVKNVTVAG